MPSRERPRDREFDVVRQGDLTARDATLSLLAARADEATICPIEVERALACENENTADVDWREMMPAVDAAIDLLAVEGQVRLSWKGRVLASRSGPYRIGRGARR